MIFRDDDISPNTSLDHLKKIVRITKRAWPKSRFILGVSLFAKRNKEGSVYPGAPFKHHDTPWFYNVDTFLGGLHTLRNATIGCEIASHGLIHVDHAQLDYDAQEMSILTSCNMLNTKMFIPPFGRYSEVTERICKQNDIEMLAGLDWQSLEFNEFDPNHEKWYFHSWRYKVEDYQIAINKARQEDVEASQLLAKP